MARSQSRSRQRTVDRRGHYRVKDGIGEGGSTGGSPRSKNTNKRRRSSRSRPRRSRPLRSRPRSRSYESRREGRGRRNRASATSMDGGDRRYNCERDLWSPSSGRRTRQNDRSVERARHRGGHGGRSPGASFDYDRRSLSPNCRHSLEEEVARCRNRDRYDGGGDRRLRSRHRCRRRHSPRRRVADVGSLSADANEDGGAGELSPSLSPLFGDRSTRRRRFRMATRRRGYHSRSYENHLRVRHPRLYDFAAYDLPDNGLDQSMLHRARDEEEDGYFNKGRGRYQGNTTVNRSIRGRGGDRKRSPRPSNCSQRSSASTSRRYRGGRAARRRRRQASSHPREFSPSTTNSFYRSESLLYSRKPTRRGRERRRRERSERSGRRHSRPSREDRKRAEERRGGRERRRTGSERRVRGQHAGRGDISPMLSHRRGRRGNRKRGVRIDDGGGDDENDREQVQRRGGAVTVSEDDETGVVCGDIESGSRGAAESSGEERDDVVGHFRGGPGSLVSDRYEILRDVGMGTFGRVVECVDLRKRRKKRAGGRSSVRDGSDSVAIKIVRDVRRYYDSALIEADILDDVNSRGGRGLSLCARMLDRFELNGHYCLVFECLGRSLYDFLKRHDFTPFPLYVVRDLALQLLDALDFLHGFQLIHTDLKPENILLVSNTETTYHKPASSSSSSSPSPPVVVPASTKIKVIDFGGATYDYEKKSSIINTRQYRAPEVILEVGWSTPSDLWSAGCIISELYTGDLLFATHDNMEHLALMEKAVGPFPRDMLSSSPSSARAHFDSSGRHRMMFSSSDSKVHVRRMPPLAGIVNRRDQGSGLLELLESLLTIDPKFRVTASAALASNFFKSHIL